MVAPGTRRKISRNALYDMVWSRAMIHLANEFGLSDVVFAKLCKRNKIPRPPRGYQPNDRPDGTSSLISGELMRPISHWQWLDLKNFKGEHRFNWDESVEKLKVLTLLLKSGARWRPAEKAEIISMRKSLKESPSDFSAEFVWLLAKFQAVECGVVEELFKPSGFRIHVREHLGRIIDLIERLPDVLPNG